MRQPRANKPRPHRFGVSGARRQCLGVAAPGGPSDRAEVHAPNSLAKINPAAATA
jgi:hypothetical protein